MIQIFYGEDDYSIKTKISELKREFGQSDLLSANTSTLDGESISLEELRTACQTMPFFSPRRLVIIEGLLDRFETRESKTQKAFEKKEAEAKNMAECLNHTPESNAIIITGTKQSKTNPFVKYLSGDVKTTHFPVLRDQELVDRVHQIAERAGVKISNSAVTLLIEHAGSDLWSLENEIAKLSLYTSGRAVEENDIRQVVGTSREGSIFSLVDAILEFRAGAAQIIWQLLLNAGDSGTHVLIMIGRQIQFIVRAKELRSTGMKPPEIQSHLGQNYFQMRRILNQAEKYSLDRLKEIYQRLVDTDLAIKTGKFQPELAIDLLIAELGSNTREGK